MGQPVTFPSPCSSKGRPRTVLLVILLAVMLALGGVAFAPTPAAHAGSNGQQLALRSAIASSVYVEGYNQNNIYVAHCFPTPNLTTVTTGWWWKATANSLVYTTSFYNNNCSGEVIYSGKISSECFLGWNVPADYPTNTYVIPLDTLNC